tara:strand:- start:2365 stop:2859 length:495 start_codon:yes stop_codon:yes gene_type:complete
MPTVGKKKFDYDKEGMAAAEAEAAATGQDVESNDAALNVIIGALPAAADEPMAEPAPEPMAEPAPEGGGEPPANLPEANVMFDLYRAIHGADFDPASPVSMEQMSQIEGVLAENPQVVQGLMSGEVSLTEAALVLFRNVDLDRGQQNMVPPDVEIPEPDVGSYM